MIPYAKKMLALSADLEEQFSKETHGTIVIGATESICIHRLPEIISTFKTMHPDIELSIQIIDSPDFSSLLMDSQLDLALELNLQNQQTSFITEALLEEEIGVFAAADFELAQKSNPLIEDFADVPLLLTSKECVYRTLFEDELKAAEITPKIVFETSSVEAIKQTAISGLGVCVLPLITVKDELEKGTLVRINYQTDYKMMTQLIYHKDKWFSDYLKDFIQVIRTVIV
ncbi:LysR family transcriptional regulator [Enterococcus wangshanyuanii]|uniref:LysR family transcriptional regulator n=1 Tax=Enterococcus wangshanyuanii TaxID=2005703 RepID=A0ABQ1P4D7_9ENTE|nr:LysR family transcriptional regulator [Enterococcus wangshanyuanii]